MDVDLIKRLAITVAITYLILVIAYVIGYNLYFMTGRGGFFTFGPDGNATLTVYLVFIPTIIVNVVQIIRKEEDVFLMIVGYIFLTVGALVLSTRLGVLG